MARECTEPRKPKCRNCDELGHTARECEKPKDSAWLPSQSEPQQADNVSQ
jgi:hypothetical protein